MLNNPACIFTNALTANLNCFEQQRCLKHWFVYNLFHIKQAHTFIYFSTTDKQCTLPASVHFGWPDSIDIISRKCHLECHLHNTYEKCWKVSPTLRVHTILYHYKQPSSSTSPNTSAHWDSYSVDGLPLAFAQSATSYSLHIPLLQHRIKLQ